jgi:hypothetical protein
MKISSHTLRSVYGIVRESTAEDPAFAEPSTVLRYPFASVAALCSGL